MFAEFLILESVPQGVFALDREHRCTFANPAAARLLGYQSPGELVGKELVALLHPRGVERVLEELGDLLRSGKGARFENEFLRRDGSTLAVECALSPLDQEGAPRGGVLSFLDITERKRARAGREKLIADLHEQERLLRALLEQMPVGVVVARSSGEPMLANPRAQEILTLSESETADLMARGKYGLVHLTDGRPYEQKEMPLARALESGQPVTEEMGLVRRDGSCATLLAAAAPIRLGRGPAKAAVTTFLDISERKRGEFTLQVLASASAELGAGLDRAAVFERLARLSVRALADWSAVYQQEGERLRRVAAAHRDSRLDQWVRSQPALPFAAPAELPTAALAMHETPAQCGLPEAELRLIEALGKGHCLWAPLLSESSRLGFLVAGAVGRRFDQQDLAVADSLATRAALAAENARLYAEAQQAARASEEILAVVSHDLRNPLASIAMAAELLDKLLLGGGHFPGRGPLEVIRCSARRMQRLIADLLDFSALRAGSLALELRFQRLGDLLADAVEMARMHGEKKRLSVRVVDQAGRAQVRCDRERLLQVFSNLIGNAVRFSPEGSRLELGAEGKGSEARLWISDQGPGVPAEHLPFLFQPFWSRGARGQRGTGLGLYISKGIIEAQQGRIEVQSRVGEGTTFSFTLPLSVPPREQGRVVGGGAECS